MIRTITLRGYTAALEDGCLGLCLGTAGSYGLEQLRVVADAKAAAPATGWESLTATVVDGWGEEVTMPAAEPVTGLAVETGEGWQDMTIYATFHPPDGSEPVRVLVDGVIDIPPEATAAQGRLPGRIVFTGLRNGARRISCDVTYTVLGHAGIEGSESAGATPTLTEQAVIAAGKAQQAAEAAKQTAEATSDSLARHREEYYALEERVDAIENTRVEMEGLVTGAVDTVNGMKLTVSTFTDRVTDMETTVTSQSTQITQNAQAISLAATRQELTTALSEVYTRKETDAAIQLSADSISLSVTSRVETAVGDAVASGKFNGEDGVVLRINSSRGTVFKNDSVATELTVTVYYGALQIATAAQLRAAFGESARLQWQWQRPEDDAYGIISAGDSRFSEEGFRFTLSPDDVDGRISFVCELVV